MEHYEQTDRRGHTHRWGVRWDITSAVNAGTGTIVTHTYSRDTNPFEGPAVTVDRYRLIITIGADTATDVPWTCVVRYVVQEALHPSIDGDPCWTSWAVCDTHDQALSQLEREATRLGWVQ